METVKNDKQMTQKASEKLKVSSCKLANLKLTTYVISRPTSPSLN
jgi:hypothetical protein